jgi:hypothetical protein
MQCWLSCHGRLPAGCCGILTCSTELGRALSTPRSASTSTGTARHSTASKPAHTCGSTASSGSSRRQLVPCMLLHIANTPPATWQQLCVHCMVVSGRVTHLRSHTQAAPSLQHCVEAAPCVLTPVLSRACCSRCTARQRPSRVCQARPCPAPRSCQQRQRHTAAASNTCSQQQQRSSRCSLNRSQHAVSGILQKRQHSTGASPITAPAGFTVAVTRGIRTGD